VKRVLLLVALGVGVAACHDRFAPPPPPDLAKKPYDFAVNIPPYDMAGLDMTPGDMNVIGHD
jgi:hypothetical protein